jgi:hypothetical protein
LFSLVLAIGFLSGAAAADKAKKKSTIPGTYVGQVDGDQARAILKEDGSIVVRPTQENPGFKLSGKWKRDGKLIIAKLKDPEGKEGVVTFKPAVGSLTVLKIVKPSGEVEEFKSPQFAKKKALADKGPAGVYVGEFDGEQLQVELAAKGGFNVRSAEDPDEGEIYMGKWKLTDKGLSATITDEEGAATTLRMRVTDAGFALVGTVNAEGQEKHFEARLKRVNK